MSRRLVEEKYRVKKNIELKKNIEFLQIHVEN